MTYSPPLAALALLENISDLISVLDSNGIITYTSPAISHTLGYTQITFIGRRFTDFVIAEDQTGAEEQLRRVLSNPDDVFESELHFTSPAGDIRLLQSRVVNKLQDKAIQGLIVTSRDITEERKQQLAYNAALKEIHQGLENTVAAVGSTIGARDPYTSDHQLKVGGLCLALGNELGIAQHTL